MLGRTDSRRRSLVVLLAFVVAASSLVVRLAYWQVARSAELAAVAAQQTSLRLEEPSRRGAIYDRTGTVVLASTVERDLLSATPKRLTPERRREVAANLADDPRPRGHRGGQPRRADDLRSRVRRPLPGAHARAVGPHPRAVERRGPGALGPGARATGQACLPAGRRRPRVDARGAPPRLRQP